MLATLILGIAAGAGTPYAEDRLKDLLADLPPEDAPPTAIETRLFTFVALLLGAAFLSMIFGDAHALPLALGAAIGVFGPRFMDAWRAARRPDYDS